MSKSNEYPCNGCQQMFRKGQMRAGYCERCSRALSNEYRPRTQRKNPNEARPDEVVAFDPDRLGLKQFAPVRTDGSSFVRLPSGRAKYAPGKQSRRR